MMKKLNNGVCSPKGFTDIGKSVGIKKSGRKDLAVIYSDKICHASAVYTQNKVIGAPLILTKEHLKNGKAQAIIVNSGIANVCTGKRGLKDSKKIASLLSEELEIDKKDVIVSSTGVIGKFLPIGKIQKGISNIKLELSKKSSSAVAILTTDKTVKEIAIQSDGFTIGAIAKGSGMIHPNMATMLCFITTDAEIPSKRLKYMLNAAVEESFNSISVDMDTSTSDMVTIMANGYAGKVDENKFQKVLNRICTYLAKKIAADGEGATKLLIVTVLNAFSKNDAKKLARSVVSSNLVKCAVYGSDPNWGRIICAMGNTSAKFNQDKIDVYIGNEKIVQDGRATRFNKQTVKNNMDKNEVKIVIDIKENKFNAIAYGCDMTEEYIRINSLYTT
jgi:glutamate N-acetyltransferase / amino-acid N-acetyltransferase